MKKAMKTKMIKIDMNNQMKKILQDHQYQYLPIQLRKQLSFVLYSKPTTCSNSFTT